MGSIQKRHTGDGHTRWKARYRGPDRRERSRTFTRKIDAQRWLDTIAASQHRGDWVDPDRGRITLTDWLAQTPPGANRRPSTISRDTSLIRNHLTAHLGDWPLGTITPETIDEWIAVLQAKGLSAATVRKCYGLLSQTFTRAVRRKLIVASPCVDIALPTVETSPMRTLSHVDVDNVAAAMTPRFAAVVLTAANTGLRFGELAALRTDHVDLKRRRLHVALTANDVDGQLVIGPPKTPASRRTVTLPRLLADVLRRHLVEWPTESGLVFAGSRGAVLRRQKFRRRHWEPATLEAGVAGVRFHDLRHTHAAWLVAAGVHPKVIQTRLGHASISVTLDTYGHLMDGLDVAAADALDELARPPRGLDGGGGEARVGG